MSEHEFPEPHFHNIKEQALARLAELTRDLKQYQNVRFVFYAGNMLNGHPRWNMEVVLTPIAFFALASRTNFFDAFPEDRSYGSMWRVVNAPDPIMVLLDNTFRTQEDSTMVEMQAQLAAWEAERMLQEREQENG